MLSEFLEVLHQHSSYIHVCQNGYNSGLDSNSRCVQVLIYKAKCIPDVGINVPHACYLCVNFAVTVPNRDPNVKIGVCLNNMLNNIVTLFVNIMYHVIMSYIGIYPRPIVQPTLALKARQGQRLCIYHKQQRVNTVKTCL